MKRHDYRNRQIQAMRCAGVSVAVIGKKYGLSDGRIRQIAARAVPTDGRNSLRYPLELYASIVEARAAGLLIKEIAACYALPLSTTSAILRRHHAEKQGALQRVKDVDDVLAWLGAPR